MEVEHPQVNFNPQIPELKRKGAPQVHPEVDPEKKAKLAETNGTVVITPEAPQNATPTAENGTGLVAAAGPPEEPITAEDIRKLKELLRQEEAKLLLIKR